MHTYEVLAQIFFGQKFAATVRTFFVRFSVGQTVAVDTCFGTKNFLANFAHVIDPRPMLSSDLICQ